MKCWGTKISLRTMQLKDVKTMCNWEDGDDIMFADYNFPKMTISEQKKWYKTKNNLRSKSYVIEDTKNQLIGYIAMKQINPILKTSELGIIISPKNVGKGYGTEAIKVFMNWYFGELKYKKLWLRVGAYNKRAIKSYKSLGFKFTKKYYSEFNNDKINPLQTSGFEQYQNCFKIKLGKVQALCYVMEHTKTP